MNETNAGGVRQRSVEIVVPVHEIATWVKAHGTAVKSSAYSSGSSSTTSSSTSSASPTSSTSSTGGLYRLDASDVG